MDQGPLRKRKTVHEMVGCTTQHHTTPNTTVVYGTAREGREGGTSKHNKEKPLTGRATVGLLIMPRKMPNLAGGVPNHRHRSAYRTESGVVCCSSPFCCCPSSLLLLVVVLLLLLFLPPSHFASSLLCVCVLALCVGVVAWLFVATTAPRAVVYIVRVD
jgi:hypothetical protein